MTGIEIAEIYLNSDKKKLILEPKKTT